jgi:biopolymer transport protein ExbD
MKKKQRRNGAASLNITSLMDVMTIILVFLLKSYSTEDISVAASEFLTLPVSSAQTAPKVAVNVVVSQRDILVDGQMILTIEPSADGSWQIPEAEKRGALISKLFDKLNEKAEVAKSIGDRSQNEELAFKGQVLLQVDKKLPFSVIRDVMYTAGQAQFGEFRFIVLKASG